MLPEEEGGAGEGLRAIAGPDSRARQLVGRAISRRIAARVPAQEAGRVRGAAAPKDAAIRRRDRGPERIRNAIGNAPLVREGPRDRTSSIPGAEEMRPRVWRNS